MENITEKLDNVARAAEAVTKNLYLKEAEFHPFRVACLSALEYAASAKGIEFAEENKVCAALTLSLGVDINEFYDSQKLDPERYKYKRRKLRNLSPNAVEVYKKYFAVTRNLERNRPCPESDEENLSTEITEYREKVNLISLAANCAVAFNQKIENFVNIRNNAVDFNTDTPSWFKGLYYAVMALQVIDDRVGWKGDLDNRRPSFFTAFLPQAGNLEELKKPGKISKAVLEKMDQLFEDYLTKAYQSDPEFIFPICHLTKAIKIFYPKVVGFLRTHRLPTRTKLVSQRDLQHG